MNVASKGKGTSNSTRQQKRRSKSARRPKLSRLRQPDDLTLEAWQTELRRQHGREQTFQFENVGGHPIFSEFHVTNPNRKTSYRVAIRGGTAGENYCSCPDFATNFLGTCKHIEFTLARLEKKRGGKAALARGWHPPYSEVYLQYGAARAVRFSAGSDCPKPLSRLAAKFFEADGELRPDAFDDFHVFLSKSASFGHELRAYDDALAFIAQVRDEAHRRERLASAYSRGARSAKLNALLSVPLYGYQKEGALFAAAAGRCLIGDEMGLGKTVQALAAAEIMAREFGVERVLIVCPTSLKHQWEREISRFTSRPVTVIEGRGDQRAALFQQETFYKVTNYDTVHRDVEAISRLSPELVILDEAQRIKNWETRTARAVKRIQSDYCIVLTGTPLENRLEELVSIVDYVDRHRLGPTYRLLHEHQHRDESGRVVGYRDLDRIGKTLEPVLIRRRKAEVLDQLPGRLDKTFFVPMTPQQAAHHEDNREIVARVVAKWRRFGFLSEADQRRLMIGLQNMRMSCDSTYLLDKATDCSVKPDELATLLEELFEIPDRKVVIFSQWVRMQELTIRRFDQRGWNHVFLHGGVAGRNRKSLTDQFREDPSCRAFLSTDAGGVGLNLQSADVVVNLDLPWNPAILEQRIGRVHRLGQTRPVQVFNFVAQGTIEEGMLSLLSFKKSLANGILDGGQTEIFLGGSRLKQFMQTVEKATGSISPTMVKSHSREANNGQTDGTQSAKASGSNNRASTDSRSVADTNGDPFTGFLQTGLALLERLAETARANGSKRSKKGPARAAGPFETLRDETTGRQYLKVPMPNSELLDQMLATVGRLLEDRRG